MIKKKKCASPLQVVKRKILNWEEEETTCIYKDNINEKFQKLKLGRLQARWKIVLMKRKRFSIIEIGFTNE